MLLLALALLLTTPALVAAHTSGPADFTCPIDGHRFNTQVDYSGTSLGQRLDLKPLGPIAAPWRIPVCPKCGFVLYKKSKKSMTAKEKKVLPAYVKSAPYRKARGESSHYRLGLILARLGRSEQDIAYAFLRACWQVEGQRAKHKRYLERTLKHYRAALGKSGSSPAIAAFLVGELERQLGRFSVAKAHFIKLRKLPKFNAKPYRRMIRHELNLIAKKDNAPHPIPQPGARRGPNRSGTKKKP